VDDYLRHLIERYRTAGILLDANLLLLLYVGTFDPQQISRFKRTQVFNLQDYVTLQALLEQFKKVITTPNILTKVSSLSNHLGSHLKPRYFAIFARGIELLEEIYLPSIQISTMAEFARFGLTDVGILHLAKDQYLVLTIDFRLSQYLSSRGIDTVNFNHLRAY
jgi:hypothetical protein